MADALAFWMSGSGDGEIRPAVLPEPGSGEVLVRALWSGISRGTESLVFAGRVPESQREAMRAPFQEGSFPGPVKYGYLSVGVVERGPSDLVGRRVFCLYPHQTAYVVPVDVVVPIPDGVPAERAVLAGTVETAVNAMWDAAPLVGDRVAVIGAGQVGCCVTRLLASIPGVDVTLVDVDPDKAAVAAALGARFSLPDGAPGDCDLVVHTSATGAGLRRALESARFEGTILDLSWYGDAPVTIPLGEAFHSRRLTIRASQVGAVAPSRRAGRSYRDRLALALDLLRDPAYDAILTGRSEFRELPATVAAIAAGDLPGLCHTIRYDEGEPCSP